MSIRIPSVFLSAAVLLALGACATPAQQAAAPATAPATGTADAAQFAADWSEHTKPLYNYGPGISPGTTSWWVPSILPRGTYRVIRRVGGQPQLVDGYKFEVDSSPMKEIRLMLPVQYSNVEALDEKYVLDSKTRTR
ncbi:hypothetical protein ACO0LO_19390 [Undibacterium sp. TJN25]|uniref:hypothetical protein n=1 Tax=Undibacterium sp. TJN25 TaxID=3413056 RepID=UPI003BF33764